uniref:3'(2'),5'-bisphosphate nucleotidase 1 n=1 Tax=Heterorhabditis bacteriophora TaxID=37862 RepID=A0A1I7WBN2_HETBA
MADTDMWVRSSFLTRLVACSVKVSEAAGGIIKKVMAGGDLKIIDKSTAGEPADLQTEADRRAQFCIVQSLLKRFGSLKIIGEEFISYFHQSKTKMQVIKVLEGCAAYVFASPGCKKWDTCAVEAVLKAAGGCLTDISGRSIRYESYVQRNNTGGVLASAPWVDHQAYVESIPQILKDTLPELSP